MKKRTITAVIALILFAPFILLANKSGGFSLVMICQLISIPATFEIIRMTGLNKKPFIFIPCFIVAAFIPVLTMIIPNEFFSGCAITFFILSFYMLSCALFDKGIGVQDCTSAFMLIFYTVISLSCIVKLYCENYGEYIYLLSFFGAWMTDSGAYIFGKLFGSHKLIPHVSPKKTVEGAIGGIVTNIGFFFAYLSVVGYFLGISIRPLYIVIISVLTSVVSMLGDLIMSLFKRHYGIKDYGNIFPGHGGMLDRFDSVLAVAPFMFIAFTLFEDFNLLM